MPTTRFRCCTARTALRLLALATTVYFFGMAPEAHALENSSSNYQPGGYGTFLVAHGSVKFSGYCHVNSNADDHDDDGHDVASNPLGPAPPQRPA